MNPSRSTRAGLAATICLVVLVIAGPGGAAYGPEAPPGPPVPGGFSTVLASRTIGPAGSTLAARTGRTSIRLVVGRRTLKQRVQFTLTRPRLLQLKSATPKGTRIVTGFALLANRLDGTPISGAFSKTNVHLIVSDTRISTKSTVLGWKPNLRRFARVDAKVSSHRASVATRRYGEYLVVSPR
jgi:hypothetical protein